MNVRKPFLQPFEKTDNKVLLVICLGSTFKEKAIIIKFLLKRFEGCVVFEDRM